MKTIKDFEIEGYLTISKSFLKKQPKEKFFSLLVYRGNKDFKIDSGAYLLCEISNSAKSGDLVIDRELIKGQPIYSVHRYKKGRGYRWLENSSGKKIFNKEWKPFGKVYKIFNMPESL